MSRMHERYRQTTDRRTDDDIANMNNEFTFAKNDAMSSLKSLNLSISVLHVLFLLTHYFTL